MKKVVKRYQECKWHVRLWRRRHYLTIPFVATRMWLNQKPDEEWQPLSYKDCWKIAKGLSQGKMHWYYTMEEFKEHFKALKEKYTKK